MSQEDDKLKKEASDAYKKVGKHVQVWVGYELKKVDEQIDSMLGFVKTLNPEAGGKTVMTKEEYDFILVKKEEMNTLIERVKKLEAKAKESAGDELVDRDDSKAEKELSAKQQAPPDASSEGVEGQKRTTVTASPAKNQKGDQVAGGQPKVKQATPDERKQTEKFVPPKKSFTVQWRGD